MVSIEEIKALVFETISLEKQLRATSNFRGNASTLYLKLKKLVQVTEQNFGKDEETRSYADKVRALIEQRISAMENNNEFNPVSVAIFDKTELDLLILEKHLVNEDFKARLDAIAAVEELNYSAALPKLIPMIGKEKHPWVISKLVKVIAMYGGIESLEVVSPFLEHEDERIRANCIEGIAAIDDSRKYPYIMKALDDSSSRVKANALKALKALGGKEFNSLIKQMVNAPSADARHSVLFVLKNMKNVLARDSLIKLLDDQDSEIQRMSGTLLAKFNDIETVKVLTDTVKNSQSQKLKDICIKSLGKIRGDAPPSLCKEINALIKTAIAPVVERQKKEEAVAIEVKVAQLKAETKRLEKQMSTAPSASQQSAVPSPASSANPTSQGQSASAAGTNDADLLAELASFSEPGDISPSRVAAGGKAFEVDHTEGTSAADIAALKKAEKQEKEQEALKKIVTRMNAALKVLSPRLKLEAEKQIKMGKIKNDAQLKIWLKRVKK